MARRRSSRNISGTAANPSALVSPGQAHPSIGRTTRRHLEWCKAHRPQRHPDRVPAQSTTSARGTKSECAAAENRRDSTLFFCSFLVRLLRSAVAFRACLIARAAATRFRSRKPKASRARRSALERCETRVQFRQRDGAVTQTQAPPYAAVSAIRVGSWRNNTLT